MRPPIPEELRRCLSSLEKPQFNMLLRSILGVSKSGDELSLENQFKIVLCDWFAHLGFLSDAQQHAAIESLGENLDSFARSWESLVGLETSVDSKPTFTVSVCDCRYISCSGKLELFDVDECVHVTELPEHAVTHIICDLTALYCKTQRRLAHVRRIAKDDEHAPSDLRAN